MEVIFLDTHTRIQSIIVLLDKEFDRILTFYISVFCSYFEKIYKVNGILIARQHLVNL